MGDYAIVIFIIVIGMVGCVIAFATLIMCLIAIMGISETAVSHLKNNKRKNHRCK